MTGFVLFVISLSAAFVLFSAPGINVWFGVGFWLALASVVGMVVGAPLMLISWSNMRGSHE